MTAYERQFELAVKSFSKDLYRFAYWMARDPHIAEDLVQECFLRAWRNWESLADEAALKKWLFAILRNEFLRRLERKQFDTIDIDDSEPQIAPGIGIDEELAVRQALAHLPESLLEPLLLQILGGYSAEEIADVNKTSVGAITTRLSRARQWLRSILHDNKVYEHPKKSERGRLL
jgi:RNA polymerase sigma-70 factor, ECF subfamily